MENPEVVRPRTRRSVAVWRSQVKIFEPQRLLRIIAIHIEEEGDQRMGSKHLSSRDSDLEHHRNTVVAPRSQRAEDASTSQQGREKPVELIVPRLPTTQPIP
jgi:hypothetical protein